MNKNLPLSPLRFKIKAKTRIDTILYLSEDKVIEGEKFKVDFEPKSLEEEWINAKLQGIYLPIELVGSKKKKPVSNPTRWLTEENVSFILRHGGFIDKEKANLPRNEKAEKIFWGSQFGFETNLTKLSKLRQLIKWNKEKRRLDDTQKQELKEFRNNFQSSAIKYTIFPISLGEHPGNHWGMLILKNKEKGNDYKAFWTSSLYDLEGEAREVKSLVEHLTNEKVIINTQMKGEKQVRGEDAGLYLCLYIKDLLENKGGKDKSRPLTLTQNYGEDGVEKFRSEWKSKWENKIGLGSWCKRGGIIKPPKESEIPEKKYKLKFKHYWVEEDKEEIEGELESAEGLRAYLEKAGEWLNPEWLKNNGAFIELEKGSFEGVDIEEGIIIDRSQCKNKGGWKEAKKLILKGEELEIITDEVLWAGKEEKEGDAPDALKKIKEKCYLVIPGEFWIREEEIPQLNPYEIPLPEDDELKEEKLLEDAWLNDWEVEISGVWEREGSSEWNFWLITTQPYFIVVQPPLEEKKPVQKGKGGITELKVHICPYNELPKVEENFQKKFGGRIKELEESEQELMDVRDDLEKQLREERRRIKELCTHWGAVDDKGEADLIKLSKKLEEEIRVKNRNAMERYEAEKEIEKLKKETIKGLEEKVTKLEKDLKWYKVEGAEAFLILTGKECEEGSVAKNSWIKDLLKGQTLTELSKERDDWRKLAEKYETEDLNSLETKIKQIIYDNNWWNEWLSEPEKLDIVVEKNFELFPTFTIKTQLISQEGRKRSYRLEESWKSKLEKRNVRAIYEHYRESKEKFEGSIEDLEEKIKLLVGTDFTREQIEELRGIFINNKLVETYNFIHEITSLTNNHKIKELEEWMTQKNEMNFQKNGEEELQQQLNELEPLLNQVTLPQTYKFINRAFVNLIALLESVEEESDEK